MLCTSSVTKQHAEHGQRPERTQSDSEREPPLSQKPQVVGRVFAAARPAQVPDRKIAGRVKSRVVV
jgi:hypothetical protein